MIRSISILTDTLMRLCVLENIMGAFCLAGSFSCLLSKMRPAMRLQSTVRNFGTCFGSFSAPIGRWWAVVPPGWCQFSHSRKNDDSNYTEVSVASFLKQSEISWLFRSCDLIFLPIFYGKVSTRKSMFTSPVQPLNWKWNPTRHRSNQIKDLQRRHRRFYQKHGILQRHLTENTSPVLPHNVYFNT